MNKKILILLLIINLIVIFSVEASSNYLNDTCSNLTEELDKNNCYVYLAEIEENLAICEKINVTWTDKINWCYEKVAKVTLNESICNKITIEKYPKQEESERQSCYSHIAVLKKNVSMCDELSTQYRVESCYRSIGVATQDPELCGKISKENYYRDGCFYDIAIGTKNSSLCESIEEDGLRIYCHKESLTKLNITSSGKIYTILIFILLLIVSILAILKITKSKLKNKLIWYGIIGGAIISLGTGIFLLQFPVSILNEPLFLFEIFFKSVWYIFVGAFIGFSISLLVIKKRNPAWIGTILGFYTGLFMGIWSVPPKYAFIPKINPVMWIVSKIKCSGGCWELLIIIPLLSILLFTLIGILIGSIIEMKNTKRYPVWVPIAIGAFLGMSIGILGPYIDNYFVSMIFNQMIILDYIFGGFAPLVYLFLWGLIGGLIGFVVVKIIHKVKKKRK